MLELAVSWVLVIALTAPGLDSLVIVIGLSVIRSSPAEFVNCSLNDFS